MSSKREFKLSHHRESRRLDAAALIALGAAGVIAPAGRYLGRLMLRQMY